jgi:hypothetical protein
MKNCPYYRVKWIGINKQGCTWEPKEHFQGEKAQTILKLYLVKKQAELVAAEKRKHDMLAGILVETGMAESNGGAEDTTDGKVACDKSVKAEDSRQRVNESPWRHHFGKWFWDNTVTPAAKRATCLLCQKTVSASSTTNLRSHLTAAHKNVLIKDLRADEAMDPGSYVTLKSLKEDFGSVEKFKDGFKKALDEQFVKMCCKKRMPLSIGK